MFKYVNIWKFLAEKKYSTEGYVILHISTYFLHIVIYNDDILKIRLMYFSNKLSRSCISVPCIRKESISKYFATFDKLLSFLQRL